MNKLDPAVFSMAGLRFLSSMIELIAAILILLTNNVKKAVAINSILAMIGPFIFIITMTIGVFQLADQLSYSKLVLIFIGVCFILFGIFK
ncbi:YqhV family protein [Bacillus alveayuensis]|uniref:Sugar phosphate permease n=1 Tax=Aeribacillus alveayuensis TaxID=279215 RepID=A0ABT9VK97_9BACI|nr:sugar phosphate permease [Bacillus alveayuensis]